MKKLTNTIAGQLILLIISAILFSQLSIISIFFLKTDDRTQEYENRYIIRRINYIYKLAKPISGEERNKLLEISSSPEIRFFISEEQVGQKLLNSSVTSHSFSDELRNVAVYTSKQTFSIDNMRKFWFSSPPHCFLGEEQVTIPPAGPYRIFSIRLNETEWFNAITLPPLNELVVLFPVMLSAFFTITGVALVVILVIRRITAPLRSLSDAATKFGRGETIDPLEVQGPYELSSSIEAFNVMHERLTRFVQDRTKMLAAISHDLRTPITSLRLRAEFIKDEDLQEKVVKTLAWIIHADSVNNFITY